MCCAKRQQYTKKMCAKAFAYNYNIFLTTFEQRIAFHSSNRKREREREMYLRW